MIELAVLDDFPLCDSALSIDLQRNCIIRSEILSTVKQMLSIEDCKTVHVEDGTERGGLSALLGKKHGSTKTKSGQEEFSNCFKLISCHISLQAQSIMEINITECE